MSISFIVDVEVPCRSVLEPCLCAQMAPVFGALLRGESTDWGALREHADPLCWQCGGTGQERVEHDERPQVNFANGNAYIIAHALGLDLGSGSGSTDLPTLRRGLVRARNITLPAELRQAVVAPGRMIQGYSRGDLDRALACLQELVDVAQRLGAVRILWG